jgi:predicted RND superfamily exporter protein
MDNEKINLWCSRFGMNVIIKYKWIFFVLIILLLVVGFNGMQNLVTDSSNESFLPENDETVVQNDRFKEIFGNEEFVFVFIETDNVFDHRVLTYIRTLSEDLEENLPFVKEVVSLTDIEYVEATEDALKIDDLIGEKIPRDEKTLQAIKQKVMSKKIYVDRIISKDGKKTGIAISFERIPDIVYIPYRKNFAALDQMDEPPEDIIMRKDIYREKEANQQKDRRFTKVRDPRKLIGPALNTILRRHKTDRYNVIATGVPVIDFEAEWIISTEGTKFGLVALVVSIILLIVIFRSFTAVIAPFLVLCATLVILYGIMGFMGVPITMTSLIITPLILVISVSYSIHVINHFQHHFRRSGDRKGAVRYAFQHSTWPCFLTAVTTAIGFTSFIIVPIKPIREMGITCAVGVFIAYFLVMIIIPGFFSLGRNKVVVKNNPGPKGTGRYKPAKSFVTRWADFVIGHSKVVGIVSLVILVVALGFSFGVRVETDTTEMLGENVDFVKNCKYTLLIGLGEFTLLKCSLSFPKRLWQKTRECFKL